MKAYKGLAALATAGAILMLSAISADAKPEYSKLTKKSCVTCHVTAKSKDLNDTGKHYKEHKKLPATK